MLTQQIASRRSHRKENSFYFIGGVDSDHNTRARVLGYQDELAALNIAIHADTIVTNGYGPDTAAVTIRDIYGKLNGLPEALFVNSTSPLRASSVFSRHCRLTRFGSAPSDVSTGIPSSKFSTSRL